MKVFRNILYGLLQICVVVGWTWLLWSTPEARTNHAFWAGALIWGAGLAAIATAIIHWSAVGLVALWRLLLRPLSVRQVVDQERSGSFLFPGTTGGQEAPEHGSRLRIGNQPR